MFTKIKNNIQSIVLVCAGFLMSLSIFISPIYENIKVLEMHHLTEITSYNVGLNPFIVLFGDFKSVKFNFMYFLVLVAFGAALTFYFLNIKKKNFKIGRILFLVTTIVMILFAILIALLPKIFSFINSVEIYSSNPLPGVQKPNLEEITKDVVVEEENPIFNAKYIIKISPFGSFLSISILFLSLFNFYLLFCNTTYENSISNQNTNNDSMFEVRI